MAEALPEARVDTASRTIAIGAQMIDTITSGMYSRPLMIIREYVQNAADAIDEATRRGDIAPAAGRITITLSGRDRSIVIEDNGCGVSAEVAESELCSIGVSSKVHGEHRGFRGIGRMGGLAYCDKLRFETRGGGSERVTVVDWDALRLRRLVSEQDGRLAAEAALQSVITVARRNAEKSEPSQFFRVSLLGVHRFHSGELLGVPTVFRYLSEVAPVGFDEAVFPVAPTIQEHLGQIGGNRDYAIYLNGRRVLRPHSMVVPLSSQSSVDIEGIEMFQIPSRDGADLARGWYARMPFERSLPRSVAMRGLRLRQGNMQIGDEYWLQEFCSERRFSTWHIGEIHVAASLKPNARRDGFEHSAAHEAFLEQVQLLGSHLSHLCRANSSNRSRAAESKRLLDRVEELSRPGVYIDHCHMEAVQHEIAALQHRIRQRVGGAAIPAGECGSGLAALASSPSSAGVDLSEALDGRVLSRADRKRLLVDVVARVARQGEADGILSPAAVAETLEPYLKKQHRSAG